MFSLDQGKIGKVARNGFVGLVYVERIKSSKP